MLLHKIGRSLFIGFIALGVALVFLVPYYYRPSNEKTKSDISKIALKKNEIHSCADSVKIYFADKLVNKRLKFIAVNTNDMTIICEGSLKTAKDSNLIPGRYTIGKTGRFIEVFYGGKIAVCRTNNNSGQWWPDMENLSEN